MQRFSWVIVVAVAAVVLVVFLWPERQPVPEVQNDTIVFFGDSLVAGYGASEGNSLPEQLSRRLGRPVRNLGESGDTTAAGVARLSEVTVLEPGLVIVLLGGNDALRKRPVSETKENLRSIIETLQAEGAAVVLVGVRSGVFGFNDGYDQMYADLADEYELVYVPDALSGLFGDPRYMADAIHPNDAGYAILAERIHEAIAPIYD